MSEPHQNLYRTNLDSSPDPTVISAPCCEEQSRHQQWLAMARNPGFPWPVCPSSLGEAPLQAPLQLHIQWFPGSPLQSKSSLCRPMNKLSSVCILSRSVPHHKVTSGLAIHVPGLTWYISLIRPGHKTGGCRPNRHCLPLQELSRHNTQGADRTTRTTSLSFLWADGEGLLPRAYLDTKPSPSQTPP